MGTDINVHEEQNVTTKSVTDVQTKSNMDVESVWEKDNYIPFDDVSKYGGKHQKEICEDG